MNLKVPKTLIEKQQKIQPVSQHLPAFDEGALDGAAVKTQHIHLDVGGVKNLNPSDIENKGSQFDRKNTSRISKDHVTDISVKLEKPAQEQQEMNTTKKIYVDEETAKRFKSLGQILKWAKEEKARLEREEMFKEAGIEPNLIDSGKQDESG